MVDRNIVTVTVELWTRRVLRCRLTPMLRPPSAHARSAVPEAVKARAKALTKDYAHCFSAWKSDASIETVEDVQEVIHQLRANGGHRAWRDAQALLQCL
jgi:hypothetical protein